MHTPITEKQIMQLKRGDALLIHGTFRRIFSDGDIGIDVKETNIHTDQPQDNLIYVSPTCISLPSQPPTSVGSQPKYDPCRKFRKGDKVRVVEWNGRDIARVGQIGYVVSDEYNSRVELTIDGWTKDVFYPACHLELVTPVEELEPFRVEENCGVWRVLNKKSNLIASAYNESGHHHAKEAAEAERDRLNAEYRKEQK